MSEDISIRVVGLRRFVTLCKIAPYENSFTYLLTYTHTTFSLNVNLKWNDSDVQQKAKIIDDK